MQQDKQKEIDFFNNHATEQDYDVFAPTTNEFIVEKCLKGSDIPSNCIVVDLGCGSGAFTDILSRKGICAIGLDLSQGLLKVGSQRYIGPSFVAGDVEHLPFDDESLDFVLLSGIIHHLPDPIQCAREVYRVLKPGGQFAGFDPNRFNPFMYFYRDQSSPFYSSKGVTENERPVVPKKVAAYFQSAGFNVTTDFLSGLEYRYVASGPVRWLLPLYNTLDKLLFRPKLLRRFSAFVITRGTKS
jgi:ubiquinone/menaquinone biosynthesis C-methylase UbiE